MITKEELAARLNGREYRSEISKAEEAEAKAAGLLVIFGASDDLVEFRGAFSDEIGAYNGTRALITRTRVLPSWEDLEKDDETDVQLWLADKAEAREIIAEWDEGGFSWVITAAVPHASFVVMDEGDTYCAGIVLAVAELVPA